MTEGEIPVTPNPANNNTNIGPNEAQAKAIMDQMGGAAGMGNMPPALMAMIGNAKLEAAAFEKLVKEALQILLKNQTLTYSKLQHIESMLTEMGAKPA